MFLVKVDYNVMFNLKKNIQSRKELVDTFFDEEKLLTSHLNFYKSLSFVRIAHRYSLTLSLKMVSNVTSSVSTSVDISNEIKYIVLQICHILSIVCCIFTLIHLLLNRNLRSGLHNHVPLTLLIISILDSFLNHPFTLNYLRTGQVTPSTNSLCLFWNLINTNLTTATYLTMAWASIERHLLIFNSRLFAIQSYRVLFHYIPLLIVSFIYPTMFSIVITFFYPCLNTFNMGSIFCGYSCALKVQSIAIYARIAHNFVPTMLVLGFTIALLLRVILKKREVQRNQFGWRKCRRMTIQLMSIATLFLALTLPTTLVSIIQNCCLPTFAASIQIPYLGFLVRFLNILIPLICLSLLPELWLKLLLCKIRNGRVVPTLTRNNGVL